MGSKMRHLHKNIAAFIILAISTVGASASTVWAPTDTTVDTIYLSFFPGGSLGPDAGFGIFGGSAVVDGAAAPLIEIATVDQIGFTQLADLSWTISNGAGDTATLGGTNAFQIGFSLDTTLPGNWVGDVNSAFLGGDFYQVFFPGIWDGTLLVSDVEIFAAPVPAALPLFLTALAGLGLLSRRRKRKAVVA